MINFLNHKERIQLLQVIGKSSQLRTPEERSDFFTLCSLGDYCQSVQINQPLDKFRISLYNQLCKVYITIDNDKKLALIIFLEYLKELDSHLSSEDKTFIEHIINKCQQTPQSYSQQNTNKIKQQLNFYRQNPTFPNQQPYNQNYPPQTPENKIDKQPVIKYNLTQLMTQLQNELKQRGAFAFAININGDYSILDNYLMQRIFLELKNRTAKSHHRFDITLYPEDMANSHTAIEQKISDRYQSNLIELLESHQNSNLVLIIWNSKIPCKQIEQVAQIFGKGIETQVVPKLQKYRCCLVIIWVNIGMNPINIPSIPILQPPEKFDLEDLGDWFYNLLLQEWQIEEVEIPKLVNRIKDCHGYFWDTYREIDKIIHERQGGFYG